MAHDEDGRVSLAEVRTSGGVVKALSTNWRGCQFEEVKAPEEFNGGGMLDQ